MKRIHKKGNKKFLFVIPAVLLVVAATSIAVWAYTKNSSKIINSLKLAGSGVKILEDSDPGFGKREISFYNEGTGAAPVLLRISYSETWTNSNGEILNNLSSGSDVVSKTWTSDFTNYFTNGNDGWYYYGKVLNPEVAVQVLSSITLNDNNYQLYNYDISFRYEAVQATPEAAQELWGKTASIDNAGVVTWAP